MSITSCKKRYALTPRGKATRRNWLLKKHYGISHDEYEQILKAQNGACALCSRTPALERHQRLCVDHDHDKQIGDAGFVRGLLCRRHNDAVHKIGDNVEGALRLLAYLKPK